METYIIGIFSHNTNSNFLYMIDNVNSEVEALREALCLNLSKNIIVSNWIKELPNDIEEIKKMASDYKMLVISDAIKV